MMTANLEPGREIPSSLLHLPDGSHYLQTCKKTYKQNREETISVV